MNNVRNTGMGPTFGLAQAPSLSPWRTKADALLHNLNDGMITVRDNFARALPTDEVDNVLKTGTLRLIQPGEPLALKGQGKTHEYVIISGNVRVTADPTVAQISAGESGNTIAVLGRGEWTGLSGKPTWQANLHATEETVVLAVPHATLEALKLTYPSVAQAATQISHDRLQRIADVEAPHKSPSTTVDIFYDN